MNDDQERGANDAMLAAEWGESISAYVDGELSPTDAQRVERLLAESPAAARLADELREMATACREAPTPAFSNDLAASVVAEALRRQAEDAAEADERMVEPVDRLEPEGEFGLPFGQSSQNKWMWAVFAAAAAVMIGFYGRPAAPAGGPTVANRATAQQIDQSLVAMQRVMPGTRVRQVQATPDSYVRFQRLLAQRAAAQPVRAPGGLMEVIQKSGGVIEPVGPKVVSTGGDQQAATEELLCVEADEAELDRLLGELGGEVVQVESDRSPAEAAQKTPRASGAPQSAARPSGVRGVWRVRLTPEAAAQLIAQQRAQPAQPGQRRLVVLRIQVKPSAP